MKSFLRLMVGTTSALIVSVGIIAALPTTAAAGECFYGLFDNCEVPGFGRDVNNGNDGRAAPEGDVGDGGFGGGDDDNGHGNDDDGHDDDNPGKGKGNGNGKGKGGPGK